MISLHKTVHVREFPEKQNCAWTPLCGCGDFPKWRVALSAWWPLFLLIVPSLSLSSIFPLAWVATVPRNLQPRWCVIFSPFIPSAYPPRCLIYLQSSFHMLTDVQMIFQDPAVSHPRPLQYGTVLFLYTKSFFFCNGKWCFIGKWYFNFLWKWFSILYTSQLKKK